MFFDTSLTMRIMFLRLLKELTGIELTFDDIKTDNAYNALNKLLQENISLQKKIDAKNFIKKKYTFTKIEVIQSIIQHNHFTPNQKKFLLILGKLKSGKATRESLIEKIGIEKSETKENARSCLKYLKNSVCKKLKKYNYTNEIIINPLFRKPLGYQLIINPLESNSFEIEIK